MSMHPDDPSPSPNPISRLHRSRTSLAGSAEHGALIALVSVLGLGAFSALGTSAGDAIAGKVGGRHVAGEPVARTGLPQPAPPLRVAPDHAGSPGSTVAADAAVDVFARAARGLYRDVPVQVPRSLDGAASLLKQRDLFGAIDTEKLSASEFVARIQSVYPELDEAGLRLNYDLLTEFKHLRDAGAIDGSVSWSNIALHQTADDIAWAIALLQDARRGPTSAGFVVEQLTNARKHFGSTGKPVPEEFFARIMLAAEIFENGSTPERIRRVFRAGRSASAGDEFAALSRVLRRYPGAMPSAFASRYAQDAAGALATLPGEVREYLAGDVLPILRSSVTDANGATERLFSYEQEAEIVAGIVGGDAERAWDAATGAARFAGAAQAQDVLDVIEFAAAMFTRFDPGAVPLRRFEEAEATELVRLGADLTALRAREAGGTAVGDLVEVLDGADLPLRPGRSQRHATRVLDAVLQAVARGLPEEFERLSAYLTDIFDDFPEQLANDLRALTERFAEAD